MGAFHGRMVRGGPGDPLPWLREFCDPDVELDLSRRGIDPGVYHGFAGFLRLRAQDSDVWQESRFQAEEVIDAGDHFLLFTHNSGTARSGVRLSVRVGHALTL